MAMNWRTNKLKGSLQFERWEPITPDDNTPIGFCRGIRCNADGDLVLTNSAGDLETFTMTAGEMLPVIGNSVIVMVTGTDGTFTRVW